ncbi:MAG TPA: molybdopterin converting factor subunit 1 [Geminicoccaceae bacterium]|nr:molybdopterin converting factor subunit 1 [Geminicoccaceae bacterium]
MRILYFAWLRTKTGTASEQVSPPAEVTTVGELMQWLAGERPGFAEALAAPGVVRAAVNQDYAAPGDPVRPGDEVAFFPPVTGG